MILQTLGDYICYNAETSATITNQPNSSYGAFKLTVEQISNVERYTQRIIYNANQYIEYIRNYTGSWSAWQRIQANEKALLTFSSNVSIASTNYEHLAFSTIALNTPAFEINVDGDLVCKKAGDYMVSANICVGGSALQQNDRIILRLMQNNINAISLQQDVNGTQQQLNITNYLIHLSKDDVLKINYRNLTGARGTIIADQSYLTISS